LALFAQLALNLLQVETRVVWPYLAQTIVYEVAAGGPPPQNQEQVSPADQGVPLSPVAAKSKSSFEEACEVADQISLARR